MAFHQNAVRLLVVPLFHNYPDPGTEVHGQAVQTQISLEQCHSSASFLETTFEVNNSSMSHCSEK